MHACIWAGKPYFIEDLAERLAMVVGTPAEEMLVPMIEVVDDLVATLPEMLRPTRTLGPFYKAALPLFVPTMANAQPLEFRQELDQLLGRVFSLADGEVLER